MKRILLAILLGSLTGVAMANPVRLCNATLRGPDDITYRVRQLANPPGVGLLTTESQLVDCTDTTSTINCIIGLTVLLRDVDADLVVDEIPCNNYSLECGKETTITLSHDWGRIWAGNWEYISYWQLGGCNPNAPVDSTTTVEIEVS